MMESAPFVKSWISPFTLSIMTLILFLDDVNSNIFSSFVFSTFPLLLIYQSLQSKSYINKVFFISLLELDTKMSCSVNKGKLIWRGGIVFA